MKFERKIIETVDVKYLSINLPVHFGDEDIPYYAPRRFGDAWDAIIDIDEGIVLNWPLGKTITT